MTWLIIIACLIVIAVTGVPIGAGLGLTGILILYINGGESLAVPAVWNVFTAFIFSAVPAFIFMGELLLRSGVTRRLYDAASPFFRHIPGGLLHANIAVCGLFGSVSGSSTATAAAVGSVVYPELKNRGYNGPTIVGSLAAGGTLGLLIPPSIALLIYGALQGVSIGKLFLAGVVPGVMIAGLFMVVIAIKCIRNPQFVGENEQTDMSWRMKLTLLARAWPVAIVSFVVLGSIYSGIATPTEAASIGIAISIVVGLVLKELSLRSIWEAFVDGVFTFGTITMILVGALILAQAISALGLPHEISKLIQLYEFTPIQALIAVVTIYLVLGCFFDGTSLLLMTIPFVYPVMVGLGFDPVWLGVFIVICIEIGMLTPPVGMNLFVLTAISKGDVSLVDAVRSSFLYWIVMLLAIAILAKWPAIVLALPDYFIL
jgi:tripartite ATP-independent transporter DctM subunit